MQSDSGNAEANEILTRDPELRAHLEAIGLGSVDEYTQWCARNGFSTRIAKHWRQRCQERYHAARDTIEDRLARKKQERRKPRQAIARILAGDIRRADLTQPHLRLVHQIVEATDDPPTKNALAELLLTAQKHTGLLTTEAACPQLAARDENTFVAGLLGLARSHSHWLRRPESWTPRSRNVRRQFSSLARHLLAKHPVPLFMDSVWFLGAADDAARRQHWYRRLAIGESPRRLDLPIPLTKRMAHHFLQAPTQYSVEAALRRGQVLGLGGDERLVQAILDSRLAANFDANEFWETVIRWFAQQPMLDPAQVGPLIDYIHRRRSEPRAVGDGGDPGPADAEFTMKGRTPGALIRQMRQWHARLRSEPEKPQVEWPASGFDSLDWTEGVLAAKTFRRWTITELLSQKELHQEGQVMRHCVASYANSCVLGGSSIWTMGVQRNLGRRKRVLTIELASTSGRICQVRGKANRAPSQKELDVIRRWASQEQLTFAVHLRAGP